MRISTYLTVVCIRVHTIVCVIDVLKYKLQRKRWTVLIDVIVTLPPARTPSFVYVILLLSIFYLTILSEAAASLASPPKPPLQYNLKFKYKYSYTIFPTTLNFQLKMFYVRL
jgi:hypothetical protein